MKKLLFISIFVMTIMFGCSKKQVVVANEDPILITDSCLIVTFVDSTESRYKLFRDSLKVAQMDKSYMFVLSEDIAKHNGVKYARVSDDILGWFEDGSSFGFTDSIHGIKYLIGFKTLSWWDDDKINFEL
jgi:hypothetical protein